jgi:hypothetical protein
MASRQGLMTGVIVALADIFIYERVVGASAGDVMTAEPYSATVEKAEREALIVATAFTLVVAGLMRSAEVFAVGGAAILACDFTLKHANAINPNDGKMAAENESTSYPMPSYS